MTMTETMQQATELFTQGDVAGAFAVMALGCDRLAHTTSNPDTKRRLQQCVTAAAVFSVEWSRLALDAATQVREVVGDGRAAWVRCPGDCGQSFCTLHWEHVSECPCPPIDDWDVDPYVEGGRSAEAVQP
jgi:hypothetical protein